MQFKQICYSSVENTRTNKKNGGLLQFVLPSRIGTVNSNLDLGNSFSKFPWTNDICIDLGSLIYFIIANVMK